MALGDGARDRESEPEAEAVARAGHERLEQPRAPFGSNAGPVVLDCELGQALVLVDRDANFGIGAPRHGVQRIANEVHHHLLDLHRIDPHLRRCVVGAYEPDPGRLADFRERSRFIDERREIRGPAQGRAPLGEPAHAEHDRHRALGLAVGLVEPWGAPRRARGEGLTNTKKRAESGWESSWPSTALTARSGNSVLPRCRLLRVRDSTRSAEMLMKYDLSPFALHAGTILPPDWELYQPYNYWEKPVHT